MNTLVLQHVACETPGIYEDVLRERGTSLQRVELDEGQSLPDWRGFDGIIAMGGPMSVNDEAELPWLIAEKRLIGEAVRAGTPYWGVCLGVQLLAASLGARVYKGPTPEVGLYPVRLTEAALVDPVFQGLPGEFLTMQWHGDTFDLPVGAERLATSEAYQNQSFTYQRAYGVQFHLEASREMVQSWAEIPEYVADLERVLGPGSAPRLLGAVAARADDLRAAGRAMFERWVDRIVSRAGRTEAAVRR